jgi:pimeloyl-ACP methyl ester carboxylesterase
MTTPVLPRRWPRRAAYAGAGLAVLLHSTAGASWYFASVALNADNPHSYPVRVRSVGPGRVTLTRNADTVRAIPLAYVWPGGHARLGNVLSMDRTSVVREVQLTRGVLQPGLRGYTSSYVFDGDPLTARGIEFKDVMVPTVLGGMPAWFVPGNGDTWIVAVHGRGAPRGEALRILPTLQASGRPTLVVTYRNDPGAPSSPDHRYHLGDTEWHDLAAAIRYARSQGAKRFILYGWSMGGAIVLNLMRRWRHNEAVLGVVLDCPVIDWTATFQHNARQLGIPVALTWTALRMVERRLRVRLSDLDQRRHADKLDVPVLMFVDHDDQTVASEPSIEYAAARPDLIRLVETSGAGHCRSWNLDPEPYETEVARFLGSLGAEFV